MKLREIRSINMTFFCLAMLKPGVNDLWRGGGSKLKKEHIEQELKVLYNNVATTNINQKSNI